LFVKFAEMKKTLFVVDEGGHIDLEDRDDGSVSTSYGRENTKAGCHVRGEKEGSRRCKAEGSEKRIEGQWLCGFPVRG
jgi:hypothetical protein